MECLTVIITAKTFDPPRVSLSRKEGEEEIERASE
jgi:hypothetical protein